jgi:outer membrane protein insertion porin family
LLTLLGGACLGSALLAAPAAENVVLVELRSVASLPEPERVWQAVEVKAGQPLREMDVRRTLLNLQAFSFVGRAEVRLLRGPRGVAVYVAVEPKFGVESVSLEGDLCLRRSLLEGRLPQTAGTPLAESRVVRGVYRLLDTLQEAGYEEASVRARVEIDEARRSAAVRYLVDCGPPSLVESVQFIGDLGSFTPEELAARLKLGTGDRLQRDRLEDEAERLEGWLLSVGYATARVEVPSVDPTEQPHRAVLRFPVELGPRYVLSVTGVDEDVLDRHDLLELLRSERFDEALLAQVIVDLKRFFQERGHHAVRVESLRRERDGLVELELLVEPGPVSAIQSLSFSGNEVLSDAELESRMKTRPRRQLVPGSGRLVDSDLEEDLENLESHYLLQGFADVEVGPAAIAFEGELIDIEIPVVEGARRRVVEINFAGVEDPEVRASLTGLPLTPGGGYHPRLLEETMDEIRARYEDAGYLSAQVEAEVEEAREATRVSVVVTVQEGPQVRVGRVLVRGNTRTSTRVVARTVRIENGDVVSRRLLLDAQRRLYRLGVFSRAEVRLVPGMPFAAGRDVLVRVAEGRPRRGSLGVGFDSEDGMRSLIGYSHANLWGEAVSARVELRVSEREWQFRTLVRQPFLGSFQIPVTYSLFAVEEERESFESRRRGLQVEGHRLWDSSRFALLYSYRIVEVLENPDVPLFRLDIDRNLREADIASLTPSLFLDLRDDPLLPTEGWTMNLQTELAFPLFAADSRFVKLFAQHSHYLPLRRFGVLAGSLRFGAIEALDVDESDPASLVPISEQFFAGGRTTHRAYRRDLLGIPGQTIFLCREQSDVCVGELPAGESIDEYRRVAVGGNGMLLANLDYRFPLLGPLGGTVFADAGNVWADWRDLDPADIKLGVGAGLRYLSPVGPLRLEVGWKLDREPGESPAVFFLSFGNPF